MDFNTALNSVIADLTPQPWTHTTPDGATLTVIPAGLPADPGTAEVYLQITESRTGAVQAAIATLDLPALITALSEPITQAWEHQPHWPCGTPKPRIGTWCGDDYGLILTPAGGGVRVMVAEDTGDGIEWASTVLPETQRMPLASALQRALDVARGWED